MRHSWDYGSAGSYSATVRRCRRCRATGSRFGKGSEPWHGELPGGIRYGAAVRIPPCPGTPWARVEGHALWELFNSRLAPGCPFMISDSSILSMGRDATERYAARMGWPPLPAEAWAVLP